MILCSVTVWGVTVDSFSAQSRRDENPMHGSAAIARVVQRSKAGENESSLIDRWLEQVH